MQKISNTSIYYFTNLSLWSDYTQWAIFEENTKWGGENNNINHRAQYSNQETATVTGSLNPNNLLQNGSCLALNSYTDLNHDQTINVTTDGSASTTGGSITASSYKLTAVNTASASSGSTSGAKTTISAAYTATVTLEATAKTGYKFVGWYEGSTSESTNTTYTYIAENATKTITAKFEANTCTVSVSANNAEWGTVSGGGVVEYNSSVKLSAEAKEGYKFDGWYEKSTLISSEPNYTYYNITEDKEIVAQFSPQSFYITIEESKHGQLVDYNTRENIFADYYDYGTVLNIEAVPAPGYEFIKWSDDNTDNPRTIIVEEDINGLYPIFELKDVVFTNETDLEFATYGHLTYQLTMDENRWYWIVLPYNVNVSEITTSTGGGWEDLVFTEYDAQRRADGGNGWINWKTAGKDIAAQTLIANKGYVIGPKDAPFNQDGDFVVTFPSASPTNDVTASAKASATYTGDGKNDNWNIIGTGLYHPTTKLGNINYIAVPDTNSASYYKYYYVREASGFFQTQLNHTFKPFEAFFVQYGGDYSATAEDTKSSAELAPVARAKAQEQEQIYLINMNEARTVVILNAEGYTAGEDFLEMNLSSRIEMIYSFDGTDALAFNHRAPEAQSIALGGYVATAGEQTISLNAYNANAEAVTLIDNLTGETADLLAGNYTFTAEVGSLDGRFTVVFSAPKAGDTTVNCYNSTATQLIAYGSANACTVSGLTTGEAIAIYNTMGQLVFCTVAESETLTLPALTAGNYLILHNGTTNKVALR